MHEQVYKAYEEIFTRYTITGDVLEIGAIPYDDTLLCLKSLNSARSKIGLNLNGPFSYRDFEIIKGNANKMDFKNESFDLVICNAMLEHDKYFWKTIEEIKRVTKRNGLIVVGTPGFKEYKTEKFLRKFKKVPFTWRLRRLKLFDTILTSTLTFMIHDHPGDYYRFSPQAYEDVIFSDMNDVNIISIMTPPRIIGIGSKP